MRLQILHSSYGTHCCSSNVFYLSKAVASVLTQQPAHEASSLVQLAGWLEVLLSSSKPKPVEFHNEMKNKYHSNLGSHQHFFLLLFVSQNRETRATTNEVASGTKPPKSYWFYGQQCNKITFTWFTVWPLPFEHRTHTLHFLGFT